MYGGNIVIVMRENIMRIRHDVRVWLNKTTGRFPGLSWFGVDSLFKAQIIAV